LLARESGTFALLLRRQTRLSRGVKDILVTGITVTTLLTFVARASAQNIFEAPFGRPGLSFGPMPHTNFMAHDSGSPREPFWMDRCREAQEIG
jgi:hypothetical protein